MNDSKIKILAVDDDDVTLELLVKILEREGYQVFQSKNGYEALSVLEGEDVSLVITDMKMPEMDGMELLKIITQNFPHINVIVMTAFGDIYTIKDALIYGAVEYITKPFKPHEIALVVERAYWRSLSEKNKHPKLI